MVFEIRSVSGELKLTSSLPDGGYGKETLRQIEKDGYQIFVDGKRKKYLK